VVNRVLEYFQFVFPPPDFILVTEPSPTIGISEAQRSPWSRLAAEGVSGCPICGGVVFPGAN
jgi:hypothetical protein